MAERSRRPRGPDAQRNQGRGGPPRGRPAPHRHGRWPAYGEAKVLRLSRDLRPGVLPAAIFAAPARLAAAAGAPTVHFVSLGCPKNRVDTEVMLGHTADAGYEVVADPAGAEVIVVNTCGFIGEAKQESIDAILEMAPLQGSGPLPPPGGGRLPVPALPQGAGRGAARGRPLPRHRRGGPGGRRHRRPHRPPARRRDAALPLRRPAAAPAVDGAAHRLREDRRGLRPPLRLLHHPQAARPPAQPRPPNRWCARPQDLVARGRPRAVPGGPGPHHLRPRPARRPSRRRARTSSGCWPRWPQVRGRALDPPALRLPDARSPTGCSR